MHADSHDDQAAQAAPSGGTGEAAYTGPLSEDPLSQRIAKLLADPASGLVKEFTGRVARIIHESRRHNIADMFTTSATDGRYHHLGMGQSVGYLTQDLDDSFLECKDGLLNALQKARLVNLAPQFVTVQAVIAKPVLVLDLTTPEARQVLVDAGADPANLEVEWPLHVSKQGEPVKPLLPWQLTVAVLLHNGCSGHPPIQGIVYKSIPGKGLNVVLFHHFIGDFTYLENVKVEAVLVTDIETKLGVTGSPT